MKNTNEIIEMFNNCDSINEIERKVLKKCIESAVDYGEGPYFIWDEALVEGITHNQLKGYISQLTKKGYLEQLPKGEYYFDTEICISYNDWMSIYD